MQAFILPFNADAITLEQAFQLALAHHRAGRLAEAEGICRQIRQRPT